MKREFLFLVLGLTLIAGGAGMVKVLKNHQKLGRPGVKVVAEPLFDEHGKQNASQSVPLPHQIEGFQTVTNPLQESLVGTLPKDTTYGVRGYRSADGLQVNVTVVLMGTDRTSIHKPEFCLPGQGWAVINTEVKNVSINTSSPYNLPLMKWTIGTKMKDKSGNLIDIRGIYAFWFVSENEITPYHSGRFNSIIKSLVTKGELERWAYVSCFIPCMPGQEDLAFEKVRRIITAAVPEFQTTTGKPIVSGPLFRAVM